MEFTGKDIISLGISGGAHIPAMVARANTLGRALLLDMQDLMPPEKVGLQSHIPFNMLAKSNNDDEAKNIANVALTMVEVMKTPGVKSGAAMPDCCPAGPLGTIPVGGVISSTNIHPGMHSADICCSVAISIFRDSDPATILNNIHAATHFGPGGRKDMPMPSWLRDRVLSNPFTRELVDVADYHFGTQGDGNHFAFTGRIKSDGIAALVTHHGSRGFGARLYKAGMAVAERLRQKISPETLKSNAWIDADSRDGHDYWDALQIVRDWTKANHFALHDFCGTASERFWNEHNFIFQKSDGLFYHGKGATPAFNGWADDASGLTLVPLNMAQPVLIMRGLNNPAALGFAPHGAGRNFSRTEHRKRGMGDFAVETAGIDARFYSGIVDLTELPSGYKNAANVRMQIEEYRLGEVIDEVIPHGCIMAGDWDKNAPWRKGK